MSSMKFSKEHEWVRLDKPEIATIGVSDYAQDTMGEIVFVELPDVGGTVEQGKEAGTIESVKAANDLFSPISGEVIEVNQLLEDSPELINQDAHGKGWLFKARLSDISQIDSLMDESAYNDFVTTL